MVTDWEDFELLLHHALYHEMRIAPEEHRVLMMEPPLSPKNNREKMLELMFETFDVPHFYMATQPVMSMHSSGLTTGVVVESGTYHIWNISSSPRSRINNRIDRRWSHSRGAHL